MGGGVEGEGEGGTDYSESINIPAYHQLTSYW